MKSSTTSTTTSEQLQLWPGMQRRGRCSLCHSPRPAPEKCAMCALRMERADVPHLTWAEERAQRTAEKVRLEAERRVADSARAQRVHRLSRLRGPTGLPRPVHVALVGCGATKQPGRHRARDLYIGPLFRSALAHAERTADELYVLSALHGLVALDDELEPYDLRLSQYRDLEREQWAYRVLCALASRYEGLTIDLTIYAGADYADAIKRVLHYSRGLNVHNCLTPLAGLRVGERLAWFKARRLGAAEIASAHNDCGEHITTKEEP